MLDNEVMDHTNTGRKLERLIVILSPITTSNTAVYYTQIRKECLYISQDTPTSPCHT